MSKNLSVYFRMYKVCQLVSVCRIEGFPTAAPLDLFPQRLVIIRIDHGSKRHSKSGKHLQLE